MVDKNYCIKYNNVGDIVERCKHCLDSHWCKYYDAPLSIAMYGEHDIVFDNRGYPHNVQIYPPLCGNDAGICHHYEESQTIYSKIIDDKLP